MVKKVILIFILIYILVFTTTCTIQPIWKLSYLQVHEHQGSPFTNGCYYHIDESQNNLDHKYISYWVFFKNGLVKRGGIKCTSVDSIESLVLKDLKSDFFKLPYAWETFIVRNDTLLTQHLLSSYVVIGDVGYFRGVLEDDTVFRIYEEESKELIFNVNKTYRFLPFNTLPDSTGFLYDKLNKKRYL